MILVGRQQIRDINFPNPSDFLLIVLLKRQAVSATDHEQISDRAEHQTLRTYYRSNRRPFEIGRENGKWQPDTQSFISK